MTDQAAPRQFTGLNTRAAQYLRKLDDGMLMRGVFYVLLAGVLATVIVDYRSLAQMTPAETTTTRQVPVLPAALPDGGERDRSQGGAPKVATPAEQLRADLDITLEKGGVLRLRGTILPGSAERFRGEIERVGEYVKSVALDSPGGSVEDALEISALLRENGYDTHVGEGSLCASSCPIVFAGGVDRIAEEGAAIGVHQVFSPGGQAVSADQAVSSAQTVTARVTRHLDEMGVDSALWLHALDTPPSRLYYFDREEMERYRLVTN